MFVSIKPLHVSVFFHDHLQGVLRCALCRYYSSRWFAFVEFVLLRSMWPHGATVKIRGFGHSISAVTLSVELFWFLVLRSRELRHTWTQIGAFKVIKCVVFIPRHSVSRTRSYYWRELSELHRIHCSIVRQVPGELRVQGGSSMVNTELFACILTL